MTVGIPTPSPKLELRPLFHGGERFAPPPVDDERRDARGRSLKPWLAFLTLLVVGSGMAYSLWWGAVVRHHPWYWVIPSDVWGTVRAAHWVGWGALSYIYSSHTGLVTLPGFNVLLTPFVMLSSALGLSETAPGLPGIPKPQEWLLIGPVILACSGVALFALDRLARRLELTRNRRVLLSVAATAALWPTIAMWGHPEDVLALGLVMYALVAAMNGRLGAAGWLLGGALAMQLYVIALVPLFVGLVGPRKGAGLLVRATILPGFLLVAVLVPNFGGSIHALVDQPNYPTIDHATPWVLLAPKLGHGTVAAGPGRLIGLAVAVGAGVIAFRTRANVRSLAWLCALVLAIRCLFESVMDPYYVMPVIVVGLGVAAGLSHRRFLTAVVAGAGLTVLTFFHVNMWAYWFEMVGALSVLLTAAWPGRWREACVTSPRWPPRPEDLSIGISSRGPSAREPARSSRSPASAMGKL